MQSGISVSPAFQTAFQSFSSSPSAFALLVTIDTKSSPEKIEPLETISSSHEFHASLPSLTSHLQPDRPLYLILRRHITTPPFILVSYVPNAAPVKQKMVFASTRNTLRDQLGSGSFHATMFITEAKELESGEFEKWERSEGQGGPLTEEEEQKRRVEEGEEEVRLGGTGERRMVGGGAMKLGVEGGVMERLEGLKGGGGENLVTLSIDVATETIQLAGTATTSPEGLASEISGDEPRYSFFRYSDEFGEGDSLPIVFVYTCPSGSKIKERMIYASSKLAFVEAVKAEAGLSIVKKLEASNPLEITADMIEEDFRPKQEQKQAFSRPKRPGKR